MTQEKFKDLLFDKFGCCGCTEENYLIDAIKKVLVYAQDKTETRNYANLFTELALFYIVAGILSDEDYIEHGSAIRWPWLTTKGEDLLAFLTNESFSLSE